MVTCHICQKEITKKIQTLSLCRSYVAYVLLMTVLATLMIRLCPMFWLCFTHVHFSNTSDKFTLRYFGFVLVIIALATSVIKPCDDLLASF